jgi:uncharacterized cupredoxin-like copper-binding protein
LIAVAGCTSAPPEVPVTLTEFSFEPKQITVPTGQRVTMLIQNKGSQEHSFSIPQLRIATASNVAPGQTAKLEFAAPNGTYKLLCTIPGHEEAGMVGEIRVQRR